MVWWCAACAWLAAAAGAAGARLAAAGAAGARRGPHHPRGEPHRHQRPRAKFTADSALLRDTRHIEEDLDAISKEALKGMSDKELEFHYFQLHDFDHNSLLDGLELLKAVYHTMEHEGGGAGSGESSHETEAESPSTSEMMRYIDLVDAALLEDDANEDGFISYSEFRAGRTRATIGR